MSGTYHVGPEQIQSSKEGFNAGPKIEDLQNSQETLANIVTQHGHIIAEHQGTLKGVFPAISAVQSSLGAWLSVAGVVTAIIVATLVFGVNRTMAVGDRLSDQSSHIAALEVRAGAVENGLKSVNDRLSILPQQVAQELHREDAPQKANH